MTDRKLIFHTGHDFQKLQHIMELEKDEFQPGFTKTAVKSILLGIYLDPIDNTIKTKNIENVATYECNLVYDWKERAAAYNLEWEEDKNWQPYL